MEFDVFFSISQTPDTTGYTPSESEMFTSFFDQVVLADELGFGVGWVAPIFQLRYRRGTANLLSPTIPGRSVSALISSRLQGRCSREPRGWRSAAR